MAAIHVKKCQAGHADALAEMYANQRPQPEHQNNGRNSILELPDISTIGTQIRTAIESSAGFTMTCGNCVRYLRSLNKIDNHDADEIVPKLLMELQLPAEFRSQIGSIENQRTWLTAIVAEVLQ
jgi:DNA-directed RNA polymerase subunit F